MASAEERLAAVEGELSAISERIAAIEGLLSSGEESGAGRRSAGGGFAEQLEGRLPASGSGTHADGLVAYAGAVRAGEGELLWEFERGVGELLGLELAPVAQVLAALGHPVRLELVRALLRGQKASQELQEELGLETSGSLYYHLKELTAAGIVSQPNRNRYTVEPRRVVPFLAVLVAAIDVGAV